MGTWGPGIFDDDFACEVRDEYLERLYRNDDDGSVSDAVIAHFGALDVDEAPVFWLALAATQQKLGRRVERVRTEAIAQIDSGAANAAWSHDRARARALAKLRAELTAVAPKRKPLPRRAPKRAPGDVFCLPLGDGRYAFGRVLTETERAFYRFTARERRPDLAAVLASDVLFVVGSTDDGFARREWSVIASRPLEDHLKKPTYFFHKPVGNPTCKVFDIFDPIRFEQRPLSECAELEQWGAWSAVHCVDRVLATLEGRPCPWIPKPT